MLMIASPVRILLLLAVAAFSQTPRGRVAIKEGTIVTDKGTLLRGAHISTDMFATAPSRADIAKMKALGLNTIHLYAECSDNGAPGKRAALIDGVVSATRAESMYLIMVIGGCSKNGAYDSAFVMNFWKYYAAKYANETHMVYEIMNEPFGWSSPYDQRTIQMHKLAYDIIHKAAPNTHVMFMGYSQAKLPDVSLQEIRSLQVIDWKNASIAIHGYENTSQSLLAYIKAVQAGGFAVTVTEPASVDDKFLGLPRSLWITRKLPGRDPSRLDGKRHPA